MSCSKKGEEASCTYTDPESLGRDVRDCGYRDSEAQLRLQRLEEMVTNLIQTNEKSSKSLSEKRSSHSGTGDSTPEDVIIYSPRPISESSSEADLNNKPSEKAYVNATHWTKILENVGRSRPPKRSLQRLADVLRYEKSKMFWNTSRRRARLYRPPPAQTTLTLYSA